MFKRDEYTTAQDRLQRYHMAWDLVQKQADMDGLWCITDNIEVAMLQQELRKLHTVIEGDPVCSVDKPKTETERN